MRDYYAAVKCFRLRSRSGVQADGFGEAALAVVEGPEFLGTEFEGAGYVEGIEGANAEGGAVALCEIDAGIPDLAGQVNRNPDSLLAILFEIGPYFPGFERRYSPSKDILTDRMCQFGPVELCQPNGRSLTHTSTGLRQMHAENIERGDETTIRIDRQ